MQRRPGRLVAICANGPCQREQLKPLASEWQDLPADTFKASGTSVNAALIVIDAEAAKTPPPEFAKASLRAIPRAASLAVETVAADLFSLMNL